MFVRKLIIAASVALLLPATVSFAQTSATQPAPGVTNITDVPPGGMPVYIHTETAQQRKDRLGIQEDPGINPDPNKPYWRLGYSHQIEPHAQKCATNKPRQ